MVGQDPARPSGLARGVPGVGDPAPRPLAPLSEADLTRGWPEGPPVVSVLCPTYQHVDLIGDALAGFLAQRTAFPFEVIVRDDASTDGTAELVADWAARYPAVVRAVLDPVNSRSAAGTGLKRRTPLAAEARGEFVAWCEGDDYWIDPGKLAAQVRLLGERPDAVASHHDQVTIREGLVIASALPDGMRRDRSAAELRVGTTLPMRTLMHRRDPRLDAVIPASGRVWNGDRLRTVRLGLIGPSAFAADVAPAVYRRHPGGVSTILASAPQERAEVKSRSYFWIAMHLAEQQRPREAAVHVDRAVGHLVAGSVAAGVDPRLRIGLRLVREGTRAAIRQLVGSVLRTLHLRRRDDGRPTR